jgi:HEPN domain-containing protein
MKKEIQNWLDSARYDLETAEYLFCAGRYIYTVFMCHLALEKVLKAKVEEITGEEPPKTHDLEYLTGLARLSLNEDMEDFVLELSNLSVITRYPRDFQMMLKDFSRERTELTLSKATEVFQWIERTISL